jgi:mRNA interferase MazF
MGALAVRDVVLVPFPFSDLTSAKVRPAVTLAHAGRGDWILCQITSNPYGDQRAISLNAADFAAGGLITASFARPGKLFTASGSLVIRSVGRLHDASFARVLDEVVRLLRPASSP